MTMISVTARAGVLAFGLGLAALTVPQLLDTAAAEATAAAPDDGPGTGRPASAPGGADPGRAAAHMGRRQTTPQVRNRDTTGSITPSITRSPTSSPTRDSARRPSPPALEPTRRSRAATPIPTPDPAPSARLTELLTSPKPASTAPAPATAAATAGSANPLQSLAVAAAASLDRLLATASNWLSAVPTGPVITYLQGALDLIRRNLQRFAESLPTAGLGWAVKGTSVEVKNRTDEVLVLRQDPDGIAGGSQTGQPWVFLDPGGNATFSGYHSEEKAVDVLLSVNLTKKIGDDTIATDETRMILIANNSFISAPELWIEAADPPSLAKGVNLNRAYLAYTPRKVLWMDTWNELGEGEDCYCDAVNSGGPADGPQIYVARRDDSDDYKNFYIEIFSVGATPTGGGKDLFALDKKSRYFCNGKGETYPESGGGGMR